MSRSPRCGESERLAAARDAERRLQLGADRDERPRRAATGSGSGTGHVPARAAHREGRRARPSPRSGGGSGGRGRGTRRRCRPGARVRPASSTAIGSSERLPLVMHERPAQRRPAAGGAAACTAASRRATACPARPTAPRRRPAAARARSAAPASRAARAPRRRHARRARPASRVITANGLLVAVLARAQPRDRRLVAGVAREVVAAEALDGEDRAARAADRPPRSGIDSRGPQAGQAIGSAWKRRSSGILVLAPAVGAHRERRHRRVRPVVGDGAHDREARPALRAVRERVAVAAVGRVEQLAQAVVAGGHVGRHERGRADRHARVDREMPSRRRARAARRRRSSTRASAGASARSAAAKASSAAGSPSASISTPSPSFRTKPASPCRAREPVDERAEADALDDAADAEAAPLAWFSALRGERSVFERGLDDPRDRAACVASPPSDEGGPQSCASRFRER